MSAAPVPASTVLLREAREPRPAATGSQTRSEKGSRNFRRRFFFQKVVGAGFLFGADNFFSAPKIQNVQLLFRFIMNILSLIS